MTGQTMGEPTGLQAGDVVSGLEPDELVELTRLSAFGANKTLLEGVGVGSRKVVRRPLSAEDLAKLVRVRGTGYSFDGDAETFLLGAEAERIRIGHQFDPLFAVNSSVVDPLPHQIEAVYRFLLPLPRIRFLLADDTGAGKTIMTGLLIKELLFRGAIQKILIVTPGGLTKQWQEDELQDKFGLYARRVNRASFEAEPGQFSRYEDGIFVISVDFLARNEACLQEIEKAHWDLVVVDEAHKLSAYEYGSKLDESARYKALKTVARRTDHLLFLTATPHRGRRDTFRRLLMLLDEDLFQKDEQVVRRVQQQTTSYNVAAEDFEGERSISGARNRFFLRRLKEEMVDWDSGPLFKPRHTKTLGYDLTPEEKVLYDEVTTYVRSQRKEAKAKRNRNVELTLMVMQRRLASSLYAITRTLENRLNALNEVLRILRDPAKSPTERKRLLSPGSDPGDPRDISEYEELDEEERDAVDRRIFRQVLTDDPDKVEEERDQVDRIQKMAASLRNHREAKFTELLSVLDSSDVIRDEKEKLVLFTEHRDTMMSLASRLQQKGYTVATIHGGMDVDARRQAQRDFKTRAKIMIATDAAGEGINLQFCRYLINWDIPWNPNRLEQRMGRIHRYGQQSDVWVYNLVAQNTREGGVLQKILAKLDVMREQMGSDRVYDVIDEWLEGVPLVELMQRAIDNPEVDVNAQTELELEKASRDRADGLVALQKKSSLASRLDLRAARELRDASDERRLQPLFIQRFFERAWVATGGTVQHDRNFPVWHLGGTPSSLVDVAREMRLPVAAKYETPFVFDKQLLSVASAVQLPERTKLLGPGHPLFETLIEWAIRRARHAFTKGVVLVDPNVARPMRAWLVRSVILDGRTEAKKRVANERLALVAEDHMGMRLTSPSYLLSCLAPGEGVITPDFAERANEEIQAWAYDGVTEVQLKQVRKLREEECALRKDYLEHAFSDLIMELQGELNDYQHRSLFGEDDAEECKRLEDRIRELKARKLDRMLEFELMLKLSADLPDVLTQALIVPAPAAIVDDDSKPRSGMPMRRDDEVEAIAMNVAMRYERARGWSPADVSRDGEHYDIRSEGPNAEKRYIEVKGRALSGAIILTGPELDKLRQLGSRAWLYVVTHCKGERRRIRIIQDPIPKLDAEMLYRQVQYLVGESEWSRQAVEVTEELAKVA